MLGFTHSVAQTNVIRSGAVLTEQEQRFFGLRSVIMMGKGSRETLIMREFILSALGFDLGLDAGEFGDQLVFVDRLGSDSDCCVLVAQASSRDPVNVPSQAGEITFL
jgi:hypothetical protein